MVSTFSRPTLATIALLMVALIATASARPFADGEEADKFDAYKVGSQFGQLMETITPSELEELTYYLVHRTLPGLKVRYANFRAITEKMKSEVEEKQAYWDSQIDNE